jgi:hypothetical protein
MGLRDRLRNLKNRLSGEYSAAETEIRQPPPEPTPSMPTGEVKVTRARLKRPPGGPAEEENNEG